MALRSMLLKLLEFVTNLGSLDSCYLVAYTPSLTLLQTAMLDIVYCSKRGCPGNITHFWYVQDFSLFAYFILRI